jgi:hypothetical protein
MVLSSSPRNFLQICLYDNILKVQHLMCLRIMLQDPPLRPAFDIAKTFIDPSLVVWELDLDAQHLAWPIQLGLHPTVKTMFCVTLLQQSF